MSPQIWFARAYRELCYCCLQGLSADGRRAVDSEDHRPQSQLLPGAQASPHQPGVWSVMDCLDSCNIVLCNYAMSPSSSVGLDVEETYTPHYLGKTTQVLYTTVPVRLTKSV